MADGLQQMIDEADNSYEVVVALVFDRKSIILRLAKSEHGQVEELVPPLILEEP